MQSVVVEVIALIEAPFYFMGFEEKRILIESVVNDLTGLITIDYNNNKLLLHVFILEVIFYKEKSI